MNLFLRFGIGLLCFIAFLPASFACSCLRSTPAALYGDASAVFTGTVQEIIVSESINRVDVFFRVTELWKGILGDELWLSTSGSSASCGIEFIRGKTYTVLAHTLEDGTLRVNSCGGTQEYRTSSEMMKYLRSLKSSSSSSSSWSSKSSSSRPSGSSTSSACAPYVCPNGKTYPACTADGHPIYYFAYPCQFDSGNMFIDVPQNHRYYDAIRFVKDEGIVSGYSDDSFHPDDLVNRVEFLKFLIEARVGHDVESCEAFVESRFSDVDGSAWYGMYLCFALKQGIISGYPNGTFRPGNAVNFAEAAKILAGTFDLPQLLIYYPEWWQGPIQTLSSMGILPPTYVRPEQFVTRGEMAFMIRAVRRPGGGISSWSSSSRSAVAKDGCKIGGCSAHLCVEQYSDGISTCEWSPAYACYQSGTCERQPNGQCAWTQTSDLRKCLNNAR